MKLELYTSNFATVFSKNFITPSKTEDMFISIATYTKPFYKCDEYFGVRFGAYGMTLEEYREYLEYLEKDKVIQALVELLNLKNLQATKKDTETLRIFFLCYENIEKKQCHRTIFKDFLNERYNLNIKEYQK